MKRILLASTSLLLIFPDIALALQAQPQTRPAPGRVRPAKPVRPTPPRPGTGGPQIQPPRPGGPQIQPPRPGGPGGPQIQPPRPGNGVRPPRPRPPTPPRPNPGNGIRPPHRPGAGRPPNFRPIRDPSFRYPRGYRYRRWTVGLLLPALFLSQTYYYDNWAPLGVGAPPPGYRWVRYGPDLLLVQIRTHRIVDVIYGAFY